MKGKFKMFEVREYEDKYKIYELIDIEVTKKYLQ